MFEAKGENDICVCIHHSLSEELCGRQDIAGGPAYEILIGGWANTKTVIRKYGHVQAAVTRDRNQRAVIVNTNVFCRYRITANKGRITIWREPTGDDNNREELLDWLDPEPERGLTCVGLATWNKPVQYQNVQVLPLPNCNLMETKYNGGLFFNNAALSDVTFVVGARKIRIFAHCVLLASYENAVTRERLIPSNPRCANPSLPAASEAAAAASPSSLSSFDGTYLPEDGGIERAPPGSVDENLASSSSTASDDGRRAPLIVTLEDVEPLLFLRLLKFIYTGKIGKLVDNQPAQLVALARRFGVESLAAALLEPGNVRAGGSEHTPPCPQAEFYKSERFSDVVFAIELSKGVRTRVRAHRVVLSLWSDPFYAMFTNTMRESQQGEIELHDIKLPAFQLLLEFCYRGAVDIVAKQSLPLLFAADRFCVAPVVKQCTEFLGQHIDVANVCSMLSHVRLFRWTGLQHHCYRFLESNFQAVVERPEFVDMDRDSLMELIVSDQVLVANEAVVYNAILRWAYGGAHEQHPAGATGDYLTTSAPSVLGSASSSSSSSPSSPGTLSLASSSSSSSSSSSPSLSSPALASQLVSSGTCGSPAGSMARELSGGGGGGGGGASSAPTAAAAAAISTMATPMTTTAAVAAATTVTATTTTTTTTKTALELQQQLADYELLSLAKPRKQIKVDLQVLMTFVRLPLLGEEFLRNVVAKNPFFAESGSYLNALLQEALKYHRKQDRVSSMPHGMYVSGSHIWEGVDVTNVRLRKRRGSSLIELQYCYPGDANGVCHYIGTNYGSAKWENPHTAKRLTVTMSSPTSRYTRPEIVVNRSFKSINYATGRPAWCAIDLGANHSLICNYYTLRGSGVDSDMRDWALQARNEDHDWVTLREHLGDQLLASGDYGGWPVYGRLAQLAYRFFRVVVRGTSTLAICHWELYGYFM